MGAVTDDLATSGLVLEVAMIVDPGSDLGLNGPGEHLTGPLAEDLGQDVMAPGQWQDPDLGGRLAHGGVLLCLVGKFGVGQTSPGYAALFIFSIDDFRQYLDAEKGPLKVDVVKRRVQARSPTGGTGPEELLFITRERQSDGKFQHDYYLSNAMPETLLKELARVAKAEHRVEECFKRAKSESGLGDYQVRNWLGWHHHQTLAPLAAWFLNEETRRGNNRDPRADLAANASIDCKHDRGIFKLRRSVDTKSSQHAMASKKRSRTVLFPSFS